MRKSALFSFSVTVVPESSLALRRAETRSVCCHSSRSSARYCEMSFVKVVSDDTLLVSRSGLTRRTSMPRASRHSRWPSVPK